MFVVLLLTAVECKINGYLVNFKLNANGGIYSSLQSIMLRQNFVYGGEFDEEYLELPDYIINYRKKFSNEIGMSDPYGGVSLNWELFGNMAFPVPQWNENEKIHIFDYTTFENFNSNMQNYAEGYDAFHVSKANNTFTMNSVASSQGEEILISKTFGFYVKYSIDTDLARYKGGVIELDPYRKYTAICSNEESVKFTDLVLTPVVKFENDDLNQYSTRNINDLIIWKRIPINDLGELYLPAVLNIRAENIGDKVITIQDSFSEKELNINSKSSNIIVGHYIDALKINGGGYSSFGVESLVNDRKALEVDGVKLYITLAKEYFYETDDEKGVYISSYVDVNNVKYDESIMKFTAGFDSDIDPDTKYVTFVLHGQGDDCLPGYNSSLIITGGELLYVQDLEFIKNNDGNYEFKYQKDNKIIVRRDSKTVMLSLKCIEEKNDDELPKKPTEKKIEISLSKKKIIIIGVVAGVIVLAILVIIAVFRKRKAVKTESSANEV